MGKEEYNNLMSMLTFLKIQNDCILQLSCGSTSAYKKTYKNIVKAWEEIINEKEKGNRR